LVKTCHLIDASGYRVVNVDAVVLAEAPKIMPYRVHMLTRMQQAMRLSPPETLNIKATTTEGCGMIGRGEGIGALATALVERTSGDRDGGA